MRILFAEDEATSARQLLPTLKKAGLSVDLARSGRNAIEMLRNYDYGIAVVDLSLPYMDGYNVINSLRLLNVSTPIIILSSLDQPEAKIRAFFHRGG